MEQIDAVMDDGVQHVVLNMQQVEFINSTGMGCIVKTKKMVQSRDGDLVISAPSRFVRDALENLGLSDVLKIYESDEEALTSLEKSDGIEMEEGNNVIVHLGGKRKSPLLGRIRTLEEDRLVFETSETGLKEASKNLVKLKFRLPLFKKSHYFDIGARIVEMVHSTAGTVITVRFKEIADEDRQSIAQFVKDMQFLRKEAGR
jgi:stage II sporulation protein AA (anti-sigma F factor antagonist)